MPTLTSSRRNFLGLLAAALPVLCLKGQSAMAATGNFPVTKTDAEWRNLLSAAQFEVLRAHGTEAAGTSLLLHEKRAGFFHCAGCDNALFDSATKYDSGTGWPSFWNHLPDAIGTSTDHKLIMPRTEVHCARCGGHLGHVFEDGPKPTGLRYCMNGVALSFKAKEY